MTKDEQAKRIGDTIAYLAEIIQEKLEEEDFDGAGFFVDELQEQTNKLSKLTWELI